MRLDKYLTEAGLTRSEAREAVRRGRAALNGAVARDASAPVPAGAAVCLDGKPVGARGHIHLMMNKSRGCVCAREDGLSPTVFSFLPPEFLRAELSPVGRLDKDVTGILLFTTDGELLHRLISPRFHAEKLYRARVEGRLTEEAAARLSAGVALKDFTARPARLRIIEENLGELSVTEGKYHQVKRMFAAVGCPVIELERIAFASLPLDPALGPGAYRRLTEEEIRTLYAAARMEAE